LLQRQGDLEKAIAEFQKSRVVDPVYTFAQINLKEVQRLLILRQKPVVIDDFRYLPTKNEESLVQELRSTARIISKVSDGNIMGAGWVVKREENCLWVLTNRHIVSDPKSQRTSDKIEVEFYSRLSDNRRPRYLASIANISPIDDLDLAILKVTGAPKDIQQLTMQPGQVPLMTPIKIIGHPIIAGNWSAVSGEIINYSEQDELFAIANTTVAEGNSGGPVLNTQNQVIGMFVKIRNEGDINPRIGNIIIKGSLSATGKIGLAYRIDIVMSKLRVWKILNSTQP
jgi:hypothetical protein